MTAILPEIKKRSKTSARLRFVAIALFYYFIGNVHDNYL